ncbi:hypothetical protein CQW23_10484 [Capsicum baccatum]|uniref:non-specific serine/threonine protein kinase n=1 Tax=Capsicum baccatum TaxID=33114 RepID=A0A2G2WZR1_CAPBA|nr:hypothetical protein CQW23_10484 [Capsicum baccatum]
MEASFFLLFQLTFCSSIHNIFSATTTDSITTKQSIIDGETIVSSDGPFELGFFSPSGSSNRYIRIWYKQILRYVQTVVWVANREKPLTNTSSVQLKVNAPGILALLNEKNESIWSTNTSRSVHNPVAVLLDSGNLVVKDANDKSRGFPLAELPFSNCLARILKLDMRFTFQHGRTIMIQLQENSLVPLILLDIHRFLPKVAQMEWGTVGVPHRWIKGSLVSLYGHGQSFPHKLAFEVELGQRSISLSCSVLSRIVLSSNGDIQRFMWVDQTKRWNVHYKLPTDTCDTYSLCGVYGSCDIDSEPICECLEKFVPKYPQKWEKGDWTEGCIRRTPLDCNKEHVFLRYSGIKLPDTNHSRYNKMMTLDECGQVCSGNCSCTAYSSLDISNGDKESEAGSTRKKAKILVVSFSLLMAMILLILILLRYKRKKKKLKLSEDIELPLFPFSAITRATNNFSFNNKIGEGGFGPVYKGVLEEGQEIAVKRLSRTSMQGLDEYKNEVIYISKLQHRNLVRLLGCCIQGENMLIYEYMPNKSLDSYIFDKTKSKLLDWPKQFDIINGIARGLLYLHQDSRLRIIHRNLKASNILLDTDMNPKISDFGIARSVAGNDMGAKTRNVVGTHGYMSPEYAIDGIFSVKSDVFSFGVLVLEIVSGKRNRGFVHQDHNLNLLGHMLTNESPLPKAKEPGFLTERNLVDEAKSGSQTSSSKNEFTITLLDPRISCDIKEGFFLSYTSGDFGTLSIGNETVFKVVGISTICLKTSTGSKLVLNNVKHAPDVHLHLISIGVLDDERYVSTNGGGKWKLIKGSLVVAGGDKRRALYWTTASTYANMVNAVESASFSILWHKRLSHISDKRLNVLAKKKLLLHFESAKLEKCEHCLVGKQNKVSFKSHPPSRKTELLELTKDQVLGVFKQFQVSIERETEKKLKCIRTDNGGKYCGPFDEYCKQQGIRHHKTPPKTPQLNGLVERMNKSLIERVRCLLSEEKFSNSFWGEALLTAAYVINLSPTVALESNVPNKVWLFNPIEKKLVRSHDIVFIENQTIKDIDKAVKPESSSSDDVDNDNDVVVDDAPVQESMDESNAPL